MVGAVSEITVTVGTESKLAVVVGAVSEVRETVGADSKV